MVIALVLAVAAGFLIKDADNQPIIIQAINYVRPANNAMTDTGAVVDSGSVADTGVVADEVVAPEANADDAADEVVAPEANGDAADDEVVAPAVEPTVEAEAGVEVVAPEAAQ